MGGRSGGGWAAGWRDGIARSEPAFHHREDHEPLLEGVVVGDARDIRAGDPDDPPVEVVEVRVPSLCLAPADYGYQ